MVIWLIGISGAGKSTLGQKLYSYYREMNKKVYLIDGDEIRKFFESDLGYSKEDRIANIKRIIYASYVLSQSGITVIFCNISPFEELRNFCRKKLSGYFQIYLKKEIQKSIQADVKNIYKENLGKTEVIGMDIAFEDPIQNDLEIDVANLNEQASYELIVKNLKERGYFN